MRRVLAIGLLARRQIAGVRRAACGRHLGRLGRRLGQTRGDGAADDIEDRREQQAKARHPDHAGKHRQSQGLTHLGPGARGEGERRDAQEKLVQAREQLARKPYPLPVMKLNPAVTDIFGFKFEDFTLENYQAHPSIKAPIAV